MKTISRLLLLSRGQKVVTAIEGPVGETERTIARIDYLRGLVPTNALFAVASLLFVILRLARGIETWDGWILVAIFSWWAVSSVVVFWRARALLKTLE